MLISLNYPDIRSPTFKIFFPLYPPFLTSINFILGTSTKEHEMEIHSFIQTFATTEQILNAAAAAET